MRRNPRISMNKISQAPRVQFFDNSAYTLGRMSPQERTKVVGIDMFLKAIDKLPRNQKKIIIDQVRRLSEYTDPTQAQYQLDRILNTLKSFQVTQGLGEMIPAVANARDIIPMMSMQINLDEVSKKVAEAQREASKQINEVQREALKQVAEVQKEACKSSWLDKLKNAYQIKSLPSQASTQAVISRLKNASNQVNNDIANAYEDVGSCHWQAGNYPTPFDENDGISYHGDFNYDSSDYADFAIVASDQFANSEFSDVMDEIKKRSENIKSIIENDVVGSVQKVKLYSLLSKLKNALKLGKEGKEADVRHYMEYQYAVDSDETKFIPKDFETVDNFNDTEEIVDKQYEEEVEFVSYDNAPPESGGAEKYALSTPSLQSKVKIEIKPVKSGALREAILKLFKR